MHVRFIFWLVLLILFLYDQRYLAEKVSTGFFLIGTFIRGAGLLAVGVLHIERLWPLWAETGRWWRYALSVVSILVVYTVLQNAWDLWLYGYVIGDFAYRNFFTGFFPTLFNAFWFTAISFAFNKMLDWFQQQRQVQKLETELGSLRQQALELPHEQRTTDDFFLKSGTAHVRVSLSAITHVQGLKDYAIVFAGSEKIIVKGSLKNIEELLPNRLVRVHKSYLVAREHIQKIQSGKIIAGSHTIPIGRAYRHLINRQKAPAS